MLWCSNWKKKGSINKKTMSMPKGITFKVEAHQGGKEQASTVRTAKDLRLGSLCLPGD